MFEGKPKTAFDALLKELEWLHKKTGDSFDRTNAWASIEKIHDKLLVLMQEEPETQKKIRDLQETVSEILLLGGRDETNKDK